jgi:Arc/MetJ-type ribon-helix-helix transcriptional regulator
MTKNKFTTISIPTPLADKVREFIDGTGFTSMSDFVTFVLRDIFSEEDLKTGRADEKEHIKRRLKALGYID